MESGEKSVLLHRKAIGAVWAAFAVFAFMCFRHQQVYHSLAGCDDIGYLSMMREFAAHGIVKTDLSNLRLYGYPMFLAVLYRASVFFGFEIGPAIFAVQFSLYCAASMWLSQTVSRHMSEKAGIAIAIGMALNIFIAPYLGLALSDSLSLTIQIAIVAALANLYFGCQSKGLLALIGLVIGFMSGFAIMVRPANVLFPIAVAAGAAVCALRSKGDRLMWVFGFGSAFALGFVIAVSPQIVSNVTFYGKWTFMPVFQLGSLQIDAGQAYLKYASHMVEDGPKAWNGMPYLNPWYFGDGHRSLFWYFRHPNAGMRTVAFHIFGALDFDALFPYIYDTRPWYRPLLFIACQTANFWGVVGVIRCVKIAVVRDGGPKAPAARFAVAMLAAFVVTWLAVYSISAVENRFALPMIAIFIPFAIGAIFERVEQRKIGALLAVTFCAYLAAAAWASLFLSSLRYKA